jgi:hypothetical protein
MKTLTARSSPLKRVDKRISLGFAALLFLWLSRPLRNNTPSTPPMGERASEASKEDSHRFSRQDVMVRMKSHSATHYAGLYNVMKGVTLAAVGLVAVRILSHSVPPERVFLLLIALGSILVSYNGEAIGQAIIHLAPATIDVALPMALTVAELIVVILPGIKASQGPMPAEWFVALAIWNLIAAMLVTSVARRLHNKQYEPYLWPIVERYRARMQFDAKCACAVGVVVLIFLLCRHSHLPEADVWAYACLVAVAVAFTFGIKHHEETRKELRRGLIAIADPSSTYD